LMRNIECSRDLPSRHPMGNFVQVERAEIIAVLCCGVKPFKSRNPVQLHAVAKLIHQANGDLRQLVAVDRQGAQDTHSGLVVVPLVCGVAVLKWSGEDGTRQRKRGEQAGGHIFETGRHGWPDRQNGHGITKPQPLAPFTTARPEGTHPLSKVHENWAKGAVTDFLIFAEPALHVMLSQLDSGRA